MLNDSPCITARPWEPRVKINPRLQLELVLTSVSQTTLSDNLCDLPLIISNCSSLSWWELLFFYSFKNLQLTQNLLYFSHSVLYQNHLPSRIKSETSPSHMKFKSSWGSCFFWHKPYHNHPLPNNLIRDQNLFPDVNDLRKTFFLIIVQFYVLSVETHSTPQYPEILKLNITAVM